MSVTFEQRNGGLMIGISGTRLNAESREWLEHPLVSSVILFSRNIESVQQLKKLTADIRALPKKLLIVVDQEGGRVRRLREGFGDLCSLGKLYATASQQPNNKSILIQSHVHTLKQQLVSSGIDFSFTPVLDIAGACPVIGDRSFSDRPQEVIDYALEYVAALKKSGLPAIGKHFPGHGTVALDSHLALPEDDRSFSELAKQDLLPFRALCQAQIPALMMAHVVYPKVCNRPAGFSEFWIKTLLRDWWGYKGVIFSDDLCMVGAHWAGSIAQRVELSWEAGCEVMLVCEPDSVVEAIDGFEKLNKPGSQCCELGVALY
ncbi:MAG: beta-N-acetylhexosaminidase [bacterium]